MVFLECLPKCVRACIELRISMKIEAQNGLKLFTQKSQLNGHQLTSKNRDMNWKPKEFNFELGTTAVVSISPSGALLYIERMSTIFVNKFIGEENNTKGMMIR